MSDITPPEPVAKATFLGKLPLELRLVIYEQVFPATKARSLYIQRHVYAWNDQAGLPVSNNQTRTFLALLLTCKQMHNDLIDTLYKRHELALYTDRVSDLTAQSLVRHRLCRIEDYRNVLLRVHRLQFTVFVSGERSQDDSLLALLAYLKAVLGKREQPLESLTITMCAMGMQAQACKPTALVYAAQGFRGFGPTRFCFQNGFSGMGNEAAIEALSGRGEEKMTRPIPVLTEEETLKRLDRAWKKTMPGWYNPWKWYDAWLRRRLEV